MARSGGTLPDIQSPPLHGEGEPFVETDRIAVGDEEPLGHLRIAINLVPRLDPREQPLKLALVASDLLGGERLGELGGVGHGAQEMQYHQ
jgi:hypothetical protein